MHLSYRLICLVENTQESGYCDMSSSFKLKDLHLKCKMALDIINGTSSISV
jgi:hypothetical protein